ncbi:MAG: hypothetical protein EBX52_03595 [Proteobacteria bacterium]|nr:hypothetical protein [Pseudomonadota bacterium]
MGAALALLTFIAGAGLWHEQVHIRAIAERQLALDRCSGAAGLRLRDLLRELDASCQRIHAGLRALRLAEGTRAGAAALLRFRNASLAEKHLQERLQSIWHEEALRWNTFPGVGCGLRNAPARDPYPSFPLPVIHAALPTPDLPACLMPSVASGGIRLGIRVAELSTEALISKADSHDWEARWSR